MAADVKQIKQRAAAMQADKDLHTTVWRDCYNVTIPERGSGLWSPIVTASEAQQHKARIYDSTAPDAVTTGAATIMGAMAPANDQWFGIDVGNESDEERRFLDDASKFIWENIHASNFDAEASDAMVDEMVAGWFVLFIDEAEGGGFYFETWPLGECSIASTRSGSLVDTIKRDFTYNVGQTVAEYGLDKVSEKVRKLYEAGKLDEKVNLRHFISPRDGYKDGSRLARNLPFLSCHMERDGDHLLRESGFHEFPCSVARWRRLPGSAYATGPMSQALPDTLSLNEMAKWTLMGAEIQIAPPLIVEDDGVINAKNIKLGPRRILVASSTDAIKPLVDGADVQAGILAAERLQTSIRKILMADQLPPADGPTKTAYEWSVRVAAMRAILGPMYGRLQSEWLQSVVERCFGIAWRANIASGFALFGKPPKSLLNRNFTVRFLSPQARAQKLATVDAMDRYEADLALSAQVDASVLDVYDMEEAKREKGLLLGVPQKLIRDKRSTAAVRKANADAQKAQQEEAVAMQGQVSAQDAMAQRFATAA